MQTLPKEQEPRELSSDEFRELLNERTQRYFGLSLDEFIRDYDAGLLNDEPAAVDIALLVGEAAS